MESEIKQIENDICELNVKLSYTYLLEWIQDGIYVLKSDALARQIMAHRMATNQKSIKTTKINEILQFLEEKRCRSVHMEFYEKIAYEPNLPDKFEELARLISQEGYDPMYPIILRHIVWTVKRRLLQLDDYNPIFLNIYGAAGAGKSEFLNSMFSIFPPSMSSKVSNAADMFNDERQQYRFSESYIIIMDELAGLSKTDLNKLKNQIDTPKIVYRQLGLNKTAEGKNNAQLVGTSNTRLKNVLLADTDIRKWAEIDFYSWPDEEVPTKMVTPLHNFDWLTLWKSVDAGETSKSPFHDSKVYSEFKDWTSKKCEHENHINIFIGDIISTHGGKWLGKREIFRMYIDDAKEFGISNPNGWPSFRAKLEKMSFQVKKKTSGFGFVIPLVKKEGVVFDTDDDNDETYQKSKSLTEKLMEKPI